MGEEQDTAAETVEQSTAVAEAPVREQRSEEDRVKEILDNRERRESAERASESGDAGDDNSAGKDEDEAEGGITPQLRELGKSYGLTDADLDLYESDRELQRGLLVFDRELARRGRETLQPAAEKPADPPKGEQQTQQRLPAAPVEGQQTGDLPFDLGPDGEDGWDPATLTALRAIHKSFNDRVAVIEQRETQRQQAEWEAAKKREIDAFDRFVESLGNEELFGKSREKITDAQFANREKVFREVHALRVGYHAQGMDSSISAPLVRRGFNLAFQDHLIKQHRKSLSQQIRKQSNRRTFSAGTQRVSQATEQVSDAQKLANHPKVKEAWDAMMSEAGG